MNYADYYDCDICNGNSVGMSLFVSGCPIHCKDCFNSDIWDFNSGKEWTPEVEEKFIRLAGRDYIKRISFLGGSPLCDENVEGVASIIAKIREQYGNTKQIWIYTGYTWESIFSKVTLDNFNKNILSSKRIEAVIDADVLIDGPFECEKRDLSLAFRGSSNQRLIDVKKSIEAGEVILWSNES